MAPPKDAATTGTPSTQGPANTDTSTVDEEGSEYEDEEEGDVSRVESEASAKVTPSQLQDFTPSQAQMFMGMGRREKPVYEPGKDTRLDFVYGYISRSFRSGLAKWKDFLRNQEYKETLFDFFDNPETMFLVINCDEGALLPVKAFPPVVNTKSVYMIKKYPVTFPFVGEEETTIRDDIIIGDLPPQPLEALMIFVEEIIRPIVTSELNQDKWPETVVSDLKHQTQEICSILYTVQGQLRGKTLLPMPINLETIDENERRLERGGPGEVDLELRTSLETLVIKWSQQINEVLQQDPSKPLKDGKNPSPYVEIAFWEDRVQDLKTIYSQLNDDKVRKMAQILEKTNSTYWPCFKSIFRNVVAALAESQDILAHLKPLRRYLDAIQYSDFEDVAQHVEPMMNCVCLIWGHSRYYCSPARIIDLLQEICNLLITRAREYILAEPIFQIEPSVGQERATITVSTLELFRILYEENKGELPVYFSPGAEAKNWDFLPHLVFGRYDKFLGKMKKIKNFFDVAKEFYSLEDVDIGGNQGKYLKAYIQELHSDFIQFYDTYANIAYDYSDPLDVRFDEDFDAFREKVDHVDMRLSSILVIGFEASDTPESLYKLITTMGTLLERPIVKADFQKQYPIYVAMLDRELAKIKEMYDKVVAPYGITERKQIFPQYPPYSASVYWANGMKERIKQDMDQFQSLKLVIYDKESLELLNDKYTELMEILETMQQDAYKAWTATVSKNADMWLQENLFNFTNDGLLVVNFNNELYSTIKEVQYMKLLGYSNVPETANKIFNDKAIFRKNLSFLDQIAHAYNKILRSANNAEREILKGKLKKIDEVLKEGKEKLTWSDSGNVIWKYVEKLNQPVADMLQKFQQSQDHVAELKKLVYQWVGRPLYVRKDDEVKLLDLGEETQQKKLKQYREIEDTSKKVHVLVEKNRELLYDNNTSLDAWRLYVNYLDGIVKDALIKTAAVSIGYLADHTDPALTPCPLMQVIMELDDTGPTFTPSIEATVKDSLVDVVDELLLSVFRQGTLIKRIVPGVGDYSTDVEQSQNISEMNNDITERVQQVLQQIKEYILKFNGFSHLWEDDKKEYLAQFLKYGRQLSQEEIDAKFTGLEIPEKPPTIEQFEETIDRFENLYLEVEKFEMETVFDKWLRLNMKSFRQSLLNGCKRWSWLFKQYLIECVVGGLQDLDDFIQEATKGLTITLEAGNLNQLIGVMIWLQKMKIREVTVDKMFDPIKAYIVLLRQYHWEPPEIVYLQLEQLPIKWNKVKKLAIQVKHQAAPLQIKEAANIRTRIVKFDKKQNQFREKFKVYEFFNKECSSPYTSIDKAHDEIAQLEAQYDELVYQAGLFEVIVPEPKSLRQCPRELKFAKTIWDCIVIAESCLEDWKSTHWPGIMSDTMALECARMKMDGKQADIEIWQWDIYTTLESLSRSINH